MANNKWKSIWEKRKANMNILRGDDIRSIVLELKRCDGFDVVGGGLTYEAILRQYEQIKETLSLTGDGQSVPVTSIYEVGGGAGANLFLFEHDGIRCGEIDYSQSLTEIARCVLKTEDIVCDEALHMDVLPKYDAVLSNSVFSYFPDESYAWQVLEKMYQKAERSIGIIDIHDKEKEREFVEYRKRTVQDYEERYKELPKLFYEKQFFTEFAEKHHLQILFTKSEMDGYWNNKFVYDCYLLKQR